jgi:Uma2 family endonuclease
MNPKSASGSFPGMNRSAASLRPEGSAPARFTAAEFLRMAELGAFDDMKVELDHGEIVRMNPPHTPHAVGQALTLRALFDAVRRDDLLAVGEITIVLGDDTVRAFDAALITADALRRKVLAPEHVILGIEVSDSTLDRDLGEKLRDYAAAGIRDYWVVDAKARAVHVMSGPAGEGYEKAEIVRFGEPLELPGGLGTVVLG